MSYMTSVPDRYGLLKDFAKENRLNPTLAEQQLWTFLRGRRLGTTFKRQHIIGDFIADFVSLRNRLIIEVDGGYHMLPDQMIDDETRTHILERMGYQVIRFTNEEVLYDIDKVLERIIKTLDNIEEQL